MPMTAFLSVACSLLEERLRPEVIYFCEELYRNRTGGKPCPEKRLNDLADKAAIGMRLVIEQGFDLKRRPDLVAAEALSAMKKAALAELDEEFQLEPLIVRP